MKLTPPPAPPTPNLPALREAYRRDKAALVATLLAPLPTVRGVHGLLRKFTRLADGLPAAGLGLRDWPLHSPSDPRPPLRAVCPTIGR